MNIAYLDPASGSIIISAIVAGGAGASVAARSMMAKFRRKKMGTGDDVQGSEMTQDGVADVDEMDQDHVG